MCKGVGGEGMMSGATRGRVPGVAALGIGCDDEHKMMPSHRLSPVPVAMPY